MSLIAPPPLGDSVIETSEADPARRKPFYLSKSWAVWFQESLIARAQDASSVLKVVTLTNQSASIGATPINIGSVSAGLVRASYYARITTVDGVSSSLTVMLSWVESAVALSLSGAAMTGNSITTVQTGTLMVPIDAASSISYSTTYASNTPGQMRYMLKIAVEAIS